MFLSIRNEQRLFATKRASKHKNFFWKVAKKVSLPPILIHNFISPNRADRYSTHGIFHPDCPMRGLLVYVVFVVFPSVIVIGQWDQILPCVHQRKTTINLCSGHRLNQSQSGTALPEGKQTCTFWYLSILILLFQVAAQSTEIVEATWVIVDRFMQLSNDLSVLIIISRFNNNSSNTQPRIEEQLQQVFWNPIFNVKIWSFWHTQGMEREIEVEERISFSTCHIFQWENQRFLISSKHGR